MYQSIVLSPTIVKFLEKGIFRDEALAFLSQLGKEDIFIDASSALDREYWTLIEQSPKAEILKPAWGELRLRLKFKKTDVNLKPRPISELEQLESEVNLACRTSWQIIVAESVASSIKSNLAKKDIEASDIQNYLRPAPLSRIRALERYELKKGESFDFRNWIHKYLADARSLEIADPYICTKHALEDLDYILQKIRPDIPIQIHTLSDSARHYSRIQSTVPTDILIVENELNKLKKIYTDLKWKLEIYDDKSELHDRWIQTDRFRIELGRGLGFVNTKTKKVIGQTTIAVHLEG